MARLVLVHWDEEESIAWADELAALGWEVLVEASDASHALRLVREGNPRVVVLSLLRAPDFGVRFAESVRRSRWGHEVPFVLVGGDDDDALMTLRSDIPEATFIERDELPAALRPFEAP